MVGTDGGGVMPGQITHPRIVGSFPQILGRYVRDLGVLEVEEAIRRMTSLPAQFFRLKNKGLLREGFDADLVVFDPFTIGCPSDYHTTVPNQGLKAVYIAGQKVVEDNIYNGTCVGQVIRAGR